MTESNTRLYRRADGYVEDSDGNLGVVMKVATGRSPEGVAWFTCKLNLNHPSITLEWQLQDKCQVFPLEMGRGLLAKGWARVATDEEVEWYNDAYAQAATAPATAPTPPPAAPAPAKAEKPAAAPPAAPAKAEDKPKAAAPKTTPPPAAKK